MLDEPRLELVYVFLGQQTRLCSMQDAAGETHAAETLAPSLPDAARSCRMTRVSIYLQFASVRVVNWPLRSLFMAGQNRITTGIMQHMLYLIDGVGVPKKVYERPQIWGPRGVYWV